MNCPNCLSGETNKNGTRKGTQNYICKNCGRQFLATYSPRGYSVKVREICIRMRESGMKYREIEKITGVSHNTVILWMRHLRESDGASDAESD